MIDALNLGVQIAGLLLILLIYNEVATIRRRLTRYDQLIALAGNYRGPK